MASQLNVLMATEKLAAAVARLYAALLKGERTLEQIRRILEIDDEERVTARPPTRAPALNPSPAVQTLDLRDEG